MAVEVVEEPVAVLPLFGEVPIAFLVESRFRVEPVRDGLGGLLLIEERVIPPYVKNYDDGPDEHPSAWPCLFDVSNWGAFSAFDSGRRVGSAAIAWKMQGVGLLAGRDDVASLHDIRVHPDRRGAGVGRQLFAAAIGWARDRGCRRLVVETQNVNVPACRFYAREGCTLGAINRLAYRDLPDEVQLLWDRDLSEYVRT